MAVIQIAKIQFLTNNLMGTFVAGDVLDIFIDPDLATVPSTAFIGETAGITVSLNGVDYPSSGSAFVSLTGQSVEHYNQSICSGTYLIQVGIGAVFWPYATYVTLADHPSCTVDSDVCDLTISGTPTIVGASSSSSSDGEITVNATSSQAVIQYKLGSDFVYNDGSGHQTSGSFTGLLPGSYRIFVRDSTNCSANILVTVPVSNTYGTRWRLDYEVHVKDQHVSNTRIDIQERSFSGSVTEVCGGGTPIEIVLRGEGESDKFYPLLSTNANLTLISETNFQFTDLFTNDPKRFKVVYYKDFLGISGYETYWQGFVEPQIYRENYVPAPYEVSFTAVDRLSVLKEFVFAKADGLPFNGTMRAIQLIAQCLEKTGLNLSIICGCNIYASGMNTASTDDPLDQSYIDLRRFYLIGEAPTYDFVLRSILEAFGARIIQVASKWYILRVEELNTTFDYRVFDSTGTYVSNASLDPVIDRVPPNQAGYWWIEGDQHMEIIPGYGKISVKYDVGLFPNVLENGDFGFTSTFNSGTGTYIPTLNTEGFQVVNNGYTLSQSYETIDENNIALVLTGDEDTTGASYIQSKTYSLKMGSANKLKIIIRCKVPNPIVDVPYQIVNVIVKYGIYYLGTTGKWTTSFNIMRFFVTDFGKYTDLEVVADQPISTASSGFDFYVRVYHSYLWYYDHDGMTVLKAATTTNLPLNTRRVVKVNAGTFYTGESRIYYELEENTQAESQPNIVRPNDYNAGTNPVQWIMKLRTYPEELLAFLNPPLQVQINRSFYIDKIQVLFLDNGKEISSYVDLDKNGEPNNNLQFEKTLYLGSLLTLLRRKASFGLSLGFFGGTSGTLNIITESALSADVIFSGWLRNSSGTGWVNWTRDGVSESAKLHEIWLTMYASQYNRSHRRLSGSIISTSYFTFIRTLKETFDSNRLYIPISGSFNDKQNSFSGEFVELTNIDAVGGSGSSFSSAFVISQFGDSFD
jgi:hypothetical protein